MRAIHLRAAALALGLVAATCPAGLGMPIDPAPADARAAALQDESAPDDVVRGALAAPAKGLDVDRVIALATPDARDLVHRRIEWHGSVIDGVLAAQAADKPLLLWLYFGGPLGDC